MDNKHTHHKEIKRWANCPDGTQVWFKDKQWILINNPIWDKEYTYIVNDKFAEYRKAILDGKFIEVRRKDSSELIKTLGIHDLAFVDEGYLEDKIYTIVE